MNFKNEHGQSILAGTAFGWTSLEERRALMIAKLIYKTVNQLAPQRLYNIFHYSPILLIVIILEVLQLRSLFQGPGQIFLKKASVTVGLN